MDPAIQSMIDNLPKNTGRSLDEWFVVLKASGLEKHTDLMNLLKRKHGVSHGYANGVVLQFRNQDSPKEDDDLVAAQYSGPKAALRPLYDALVSKVREFGEDVEISPKKASVSLRRKKQFALIEPASSARLQLGINLKGERPTERLKAATGMCTHKVSITDAGKIDPELIGWLRRAYEIA